MATLTPAQVQLLEQAKKFFIGHQSAVGVLLPTAHPPMFIKSGIDGGPWGGPHRGGVPRGPLTYKDTFHRSRLDRAAWAVGSFSHVGNRPDLRVGTTRCIPPSSLVGDVQRAMTSRKAVIDGTKK